MTKNKILILSLLLFAFVGKAQESYFMPYEMPEYAAVKFHTFLVNPSLPLLGYKEQNVGLYYRQDWMGYKNPSSSLMGLSYGYKWSENNAANALVFRRSVGIMDNTGIVLNFGHRVEFSDYSSLRLGLNAIPFMSGISASRIVATNPSDEILLSSNSFGVAGSVGFDVNFAEFHFGASAQNVFDYSFSGKKMMTQFAQKNYSAHFMWRKTLEDASGVAENTIISAMARAVMENEKIYPVVNVMADMPALGWAYLGYNMKTGVLAGVGVNLMQSVSIGAEYENGVFASIPKLGHTVGVYVNYQFAGERQASYRKNSRKEPEKPKPREIEKPTKIEPVVNQTPTEIQLATRIDTEAASVIPPGYYVIVNVYREPRYALAFREKLKGKYDVASFVHPTNGMTYIYLKTSVFNQEQADKLYRENKENRADFPAGVWIMNVVAK